MNIRKPNVLTTKSIKPSEYLKLSRNYLEKSIGTNLRNKYYDPHIFQAKTFIIYSLQVWNGSFFWSKKSSYMFLMFPSSMETILMQEKSWIVKITGKTHLLFGYFYCTLRWINYLPWIVTKTILPTEACNILSLM